MELKLYQKKLLYLLSINSKYSNKDLASILKVSEDTINYNKTEMLKKGLFEYYIFFDYRKIGWKSHHLLIQLNNTKNIDFEKLKQIKDLAYINTFVGKYDLQIILLAKDEKSKNRKIHEIINILKKNLIKYDIVSYKKELKLTHVLPDYNLVNTPKPQNTKNKLYKLNKKAFISQTYKEDINLDKKDLQIIKHLINNPNANYLDIAKETKISRDTIRKRIFHYIDSEFLLHIGSFPNLKKFGYFTYCLFIDLENLDYKKIRQFALENEYVFYAEECTGSKNLFMYIWAKTPEKFSKQYKEIKDFLGKDIKELDLMFFDDLYLQIEFPTSFFN